MTTIRTWAAPAAGQPLELHERSLGPIGAEEVEVAVEYCGICHSDLSMIDNEWGMSRYPLVAGHEVIGRVVGLGPQAKGLREGQRVGIGWSSGSCMHCRPCLSGWHNMCTRVEATIVGRDGGFAERVRAHWVWAIPLPDGVRPEVAGPLLCGGVTVFTPLLEFDLKPTSRVGIVGIGGLGHMALRFARAWGCHVTAFSSSPDKTQEAHSLGAHRVVSSKDAQAIAALAGQLDLVIVTANAPLDWEALLGTLGPKGRLHVVGAVLQPIPVQAFSLMMAQKSVSGSPNGAPMAVAQMLEFCERHGIEPMVESFPMSEVNAALDRLRANRARYRIVLKNDFA